MTRPHKIAFSKMHGLGNDFVVIFDESATLHLGPSMIRKWADRREGIGFDQLLLISPSAREEVDFAYRIFNADGSEVGQCGNGARCVGAYIESKELSHKSEWVLETLSTSLSVKMLAADRVRVDFPPPKLEWNQIPMRQEPPRSIWFDGVSYDYFAVNVGNPHIVIAVEVINRDELVKLGAWANSQSLFPEGVNVSFARLLSDQELQIMVFERGVGLTQACGSAACAAAVMCAEKHGISHVMVSQPGGDLIVHYEKTSKEFYMVGDASFVFDGVIQI